MITAISMTIAAVVDGIVLATRSAVSAVTPAPKPYAVPPKPKPKPDVPDTPIDPSKPVPKPPDPPKTWADWFKAQLQKIADLLLKLGDKALIALPGMIGSVVNFFSKLWDPLLDTQLKTSRFLLLQSEAFCTRKSKRKL